MSSNVGSDKLRFPMDGAKQSRSIGRVIDSSMIRDCSDCSDGHKGMR